MSSIKERSVSNEEMGMFWRDTELSWWWYRAPIETQALMIEAFDEVMDDQTAVEDCKVWLLKQKQTQDWKTTKATADAVYALLLRGRDMLSSDALVEVKLGGVDVTPTTAASPRSEARSPKSVRRPAPASTKSAFAAAEIKPKLGEITVKKTDQGVAWGSVHWQYLEDMSKVTPYEGTPLKLKKTLFTKANTAKGPVLEPVKGALHVGDELVVRIELRTDRDMEYVHLKDQRGSGTEPVNVLSQYKYQDGLAYYETTRDTASHFFIDYLPKGVYVFEYSTRVQLRGQYQTGMARNPVHVRAGIQQPQREPAIDGEVKRNDGMLEGWKSGMPGIILLALSEIGGRLNTFGAGHGGKSCWKAGTVIENQESTENYGSK